MGSIIDPAFLKRSAVEESSPVDAGEQSNLDEKITRPPGRIPSPDPAVYGLEQPGIKDKLNPNPLTSGQPSQESATSDMSVSGNPPALTSTSSSLSASSAAGSEDTSPASINRGRFDTPPTQILQEIGSESPGLRGSSGYCTSTDGSPASLNSPYLKQGTKRTASGVVKIKEAGYVDRPTSSHPSKAFKAAEISAQLKARLSYAMIKVQNGWESRSIDQLESLRQSHQTAASNHPNSRPSWITNTARDAYFASSNAELRVSKASHGPLRSQSHTSAVSLQASSRNSGDASTFGPNRNQSHLPTLAPAPQISPRRHPNRLSVSSHPPQLPTSTRQTLSTPKTYDPTMRASNTHLSTPARQPQGILRDQAEQDAVDTLLFMSSPGNSASIKATGKSGSPGREKRVEFKAVEDWRAS